jgi:hypothetical protein
MKPEHEGYVETLHAEVLRILSAPEPNPGPA